MVPGGIDKYSFCYQNRSFIYGIGIVSTVFLLAGNFLFLWNVPAPISWLYGLFVTGTAFYLGISYFVGVTSRDFDLSLHKSLVYRWIDRSEDASIDVFLPICGEPLEIVTPTWEATKAMLACYPNMKVYVLDDRPTPKLKALAEQFGFEYIGRITNELKKAGNLRNAFARTSGEFILILDADFCPRRDLPVEMLPYMFANPRTAIVQSPQYFADSELHGWIERAAGAVQELFYRLIQVNRDHYGGAICVGTNAMYRRSALAPFGGTAPMAYSEDVHTGFQCLSSGWSIKYIPVVLAGGRCPDTLKQFFTQQYRWAMGSISLFFSDKFWDAPITRMQRVCYLTGMFFYMTTGVGVFLLPIPSIVMLLFFPEKVFWYNLLFSIPSIAFGYLGMKLWMRLPMTFDVLRVRLVSYYAHFYALRDYLLGTLEEWKPTGVASSSARFQEFSKVFFAWNVLAFFLVIFLIGMRVVQGYSIENFLLIFLVTWLNAFIFFPVIDNLMEK